MTPTVTVIGGGLAGTEAAWQLAARGVAARLYEMRPVKPTPAHQTGDLAELVCSNSLKSETVHSAPWLLKEELRRLGALLLRVAAKALLLLLQPVTTPMIIVSTQRGQVQMRLTSVPFTLLRLEST